jgi:hypothetical protein
MMCFIGDAMAQGLPERLIPYDRLYDANVLVRAKTIAGGVDVDRRWRTETGAYESTRVSNKDLEVDISGIVVDAPLELRCYFVMRNKETNQKATLFGGSQVLPSGQGRHVFSIEASRKDNRYIFDGAREQSGWSIVGWMIQAIRGKRIVGVAASSQMYEKMAGSGALPTGHQ